MKKTRGDRILLQLPVVAPSYSARDGLERDPPGIRVQCLRSNGHGAPDLFRSTGSRRPDRLVTAPRLRGRRRRISIKGMLKVHVHAKIPLFVSFKSPWTGLKRTECRSGRAAARRSLRLRPLLPREPKAYSTRYLECNRGRSWTSRVRGRIRPPTATAPNPFWAGSCQWLRFVPSLPLAGGQLRNCNTASLLCPALCQHRNGHKILCF